jgi:hypothetical protein
MTTYLSTYIVLESIPQMNKLMMKRISPNYSFPWMALLATVEHGHYPFRNHHIQLIVA